MKYITYLFLNLAWFGFFCYMIIERGWSGWSLLVPICMHWTMKDLSFNKQV